MIEAIIGVAALVVINIIAVAYTYGQTTQAVKDLSRRMARVEAIINHNSPKKEE